MPKNLQVWMKLAALWQFLRCGILASFNPRAEILFPLLVLYVKSASPAMRTNYILAFDSF